MASKKPDKVVDAIAAVLDASKAEASVIAGGPVSVPLSRAGALWLLPWMCEPECRVGARVVSSKTKKPRAIYVTPGDTRDALRILRELSAALAAADPGELELLAASTAEIDARLAGDDDEEEADGGEGGDQAADLKARRAAAARVRLAGACEGGTWHITAAYPRATADDLRRALEILDLVDGSSQQWAHDEGEAHDIAALAAKSSGFSRTNPAQIRANALEVHGADITVMDDRRPYLAMVVCRHRLAGGPWDLWTHQQWDEKFLADYIESLRLMNERVRALQEKHHAPRLATELETRTATYFQTDFARILFNPDGESVVPLLWKRIDGLDVRAELAFADAIARVDREFAGFGFTPLGDYQNSTSDPREAYRVYAGPDGAFALWGIVAGTFNMQWIFHSLLGEDFWVTTATYALPDRAPRPPRSSHRKVEKVSLATQAAEHAAHVGAHAAEGAAHQSPATMAEFLPLIDRFNAALR